MPTPRRRLELLAQSDGESEAIRTVYDTLKSFADASRLLAPEDEYLMNISRRWVVLVVKARAPIAIMIWTG